MTEESSRRPLTSRSSKWAVWSASFLANHGATANGISATSVCMALLGAGSFVAAGKGWITPWIGLLLAPFFIQLRLVCNLLDGMVAIEGGKRSATGGIWNEAPDRFADTILLVGAGMGCGHPWAGAAAAWAAVMTAYVRSLGAELTGKQDFCGPFAKPHRMAVLTVGSFIVAIEFLWRGNFSLLAPILWIIAAGSFFTVLRRLWRISKVLNSRPL